MSSEEYINVTIDGGVQKKIVVEGTGEAPPLHAQCLGEALRYLSLQRRYSQYDNN